MNPAEYQAILDDLILDEGTGPTRAGRMFPYDDATGKPPILAIVKDGRLVRSSGKLTIGYGRNLTAKGISTHEGAEFLEADVAEAVGELEEKIRWWKEQPEDVQRALLNLCFNMGSDKLLTFHNFLAALREGRRQDARRHLIDSLWIHQVGDGPGGRDDRADRILKLIDPTFTAQA